jgi:hypothetical protein
MDIALFIQTPTHDYTTRTKAARRHHRGSIRSANPALDIAILAGRISGLLKAKRRDTGKLSDVATANAAKTV